MHFITIIHPFYKMTFIHELSMKHYPSNILSLLIILMVVLPCMTCSRFLVLWFLPEPILWIYCVFDLDCFTDSVHCFARFVWFAAHLNLPWIRVQRIKKHSRNIKSINKEKYMNIHMHTHIYTLMHTHIYVHTHHLYSFPYIIYSNIHLHIQYIYTSEAWMCKN